MNQSNEQLSYDEAIEDAEKLGQKVENALALLIDTEKAKESSGPLQKSIAEQFLGKDLEKDSGTERWTKLDEAFMHNIFTRRVEALSLIRDLSKTKKKKEREEIEKKINNNKNKIRNLLEGALNGKIQEAVDNYERQQDKEYEEQIGNY